MSFKALDFICMNADCGFFQERKEFFVQGTEVPVCTCDEPMERAVSAHAGYSIKGNNSASQRPRQAGSFRGRK